MLAIHFNDYRAGTPAIMWCMADTFIIAIPDQENPKKKKAQPKPDRWREDGYCKGSDTTPRAKDIAHYKSYTCPYCKNNYKLRWTDEKFPKHGKKQMPKPVSHCAECGKDLFELDFLCSDCRG